jgi:hypothetical protein
VIRGEGGKMANNRDVLKLVAVGDTYPNRDDVFDPTRPILKSADFAFGQLGTILSTRGTQQTFSARLGPVRRLAGESAVSRPSTPHIDPEEGARRLIEAGFNVISFASNLSFNQSSEGVTDTVDLLKSKNIAVIGAGKNIDEATRPAIFERKGTRIGFLAYCSVVIPGYQAGPDKAGVAPVRATSSYQQVDWQPGAPPKVLSKADPDDLAWMVNDIKKLRPQVDVLIVSIHWGVHFIPALIADYQFEIGHAAIDAGADMILGHHAHILKGIEVYKSKPIFFSLCNYAFAMGSFAPTKVCGRYWHTALGHRFEVDLDHPVYSFPIDSQKTILVKCDIADKRIQRVAYLPMWVNSKGQAEPISRSDPRSDEHYRYMEWMCGDQGLDTRFSREANEVVIVT